MSSRTIVVLCTVLLAWAAWLRTVQAQADFIQGGGRLITGFLGVVTLDEFNRPLRTVNEQLNGFGISE